MSMFCKIILFFILNIFTILELYSANRVKGKYNLDKIFKASHETTLQRVDKNDYNIIAGKINNPTLFNQISILEENSLGIEEYDRIPIFFTNILTVMNYLLGIGEEYKTLNDLINDKKTFAIRLLIYEYFTNIPTNAKMYNVYKTKLSSQPKREIILTKNYIIDYLIEKGSSFILGYIFSFLIDDESYKKLAEEYDVFYYANKYIENQDKISKIELFKNSPIINKGLLFKTDNIYFPSIRAFVTELYCGRNDRDVELIKICTQTNICENNIEYLSEFLPLIDKIPNLEVVKDNPHSEIHKVFIGIGYSKKSIRNLKSENLKPILSEYLNTNKIKLKNYYEYEQLCKKKDDEINKYFDLIYSDKICTFIKAYSQILTGIKLSNNIKTIFDDEFTLLENAHDINKLLKKSIPFTEVSYLDSLFNYVVTIKDRLPNEEKERVSNLTKAIRLIKLSFKKVEDFYIKEMPKIVSHIIDIEILTNNNNPDYFLLALNIMMSNIEYEMKSDMISFILKPSLFQHLIKHLSGKHINNEKTYDKEATSFIFNSDNSTKCVINLVFKLLYGKLKIVNITTIRDNSKISEIDIITSISNIDKKYISPINGTISNGKTYNDALDQKNAPKYIKFVLKPSVTGFFISTFYPIINTKENVNFNMNLSELKKIKITGNFTIEDSSKDSTEESPDKKLLKIFKDVSNLLKLDVKGKIEFNFQTFY